MIPVTEHRVPVLTEVLQDSNTLFNQCPAFEICWLWLMGEGLDLLNGPPGIMAPWLLLELEQLADVVALKGGWHSFRSVLARLR